MTTIRPEDFDNLMEPRPRKLWGARVIAAYLDVSEDTVRRWARLRDVPIYRPLPGTYFAYRSELEMWLRGKPSP